MSPLPDTTTSDKIRELNELINLYDTRIERQQALLERTNRGKFKTTQVSDQVLKALVLGDLNLLKSKKEEIVDEIRVLESSNTATTNGDHSASDSDATQE